MGRILVISGRGVCEILAGHGFVEVRRREKCLNRFITPDPTPQRHRHGKMMSGPPSRQFTRSTTAVTFSLPGWLLFAYVRKSSYAEQFIYSDSNVFRYLTQEYRGNVATTMDRDSRASSIRVSKLLV